MSKGIDDASGSRKRPRAPERLSIWRPRREFMDGANGVRDIKADHLNAYPAKASSFQIPETGREENDPPAQIPARGKSRLYAYIR